MNVSNMLKNVINDEKNSKKKKSSINEEKDRLKKQINQLKSIILQIEWSLDISKFKNSKCIIPPSSISSLRTDDIQDINLQLQSELYRYSGFYCVKFTKQEYIFNFSCSNKYDKDNIFAIQIFNDQNKGVLGKWVMPMAIDLKDMIADFPIHKLKNIPCLLKICKQHVDSYFIRHEQYATLMRSISNIKNCKLQTNLGCTQINLELIGINEARPYKIEVDSVIEEELDKKTKKHLRSSLACFKQFDLHTAFEKMLNKGEFTWIKEDNEESLLDVNPSDNSDQEGFLDSFTLPQKRSLRLEKKKQQMRKRKKISGKENLINISNESDKNPISSENEEQESRKKRKITKKEKFINISSKTHKKSFENKKLKLKKKWKILGGKKFINSSDTNKTDKNSISLQNKELELKNIKQSTRQQNVSSTKSIPNNLKQKKLKQTKLKFETSHSELQNSSNTTSSDATVFKNKQINKLNKPFTSTPIRRSKYHPPNFNASINTDISNITISNNNVELKKLMRNKMSRRIKSLAETTLRRSKRISTITEFNVPNVFLYHLYVHIDIIQTVQK
ncbi:hypothetical protein E2986_02951 [Frieseomelitta varia]|uniref:Uncharacterized protein n=1 Tax=Frieseomelitta varia TaxID=561572 RepID=A0A833RR03_9HYME|nr:hypothetical protein E2986_02951 [Frieseomelitta varia]